MNDDETLRDALRDDAAGAAPASDAWDRVRARAASISHRRRIAQRTIGGLAAAAVVAGVLAAAGVFHEDENVIATNPPVDQIVAVQGPNNGGDKLVVLSAVDGHVIRTLADEIGITFGGISATPDGKTVYFARRRTALPCDRVEIAKVPSAGGDVEVVGTGSHPLVSPDGSTLVYVRPPADDPCGPSSEIVRRDLVSGEETVFAVDEVRNDVAAPRHPIAWSPDSTRWLTALCCLEESWSALLVEPVGSPGDARQLDARSPVEGATYLPDGRILVAIERQDEPSHAQLHELVVFESVPGPAENDPPTGDDFLLEPVETLLESRQNGVLRITASSSGDVLLHFGGNLLQRWRPGEAEPTTITDDIRDAAWLPAQQSEPPEPSTTTTTRIQPVLGPDQMVVARADGQLEVIAADGTVVRRLGSSGRGVPSIAVTPDGTTAYYEQGTRDRCDDTGEIDAARLDVHPPGFGGGSVGSWAALSPDGTKLAYRSGPCGGQLVVRDLSTGDRTAFPEGDQVSWTLADPADGGPLPELVGPVGWDADNRHLMLRVNREPTTEFWYVDTATTGDTLSGSMFRALGEPGAGPLSEEQGPTDFEPLGTTGRWAAVYSAVGGPSLVEYDLAGGSIVRPLCELPTWGVQIAGTDSTGRHLLLLVPSEGGGFDLYRWSEGDAVTTFVASAVTAADW